MLHSYSLFFSGILNINRKHKPSFQEQHNILALAPVVRKFALLPVSAPPLKPSASNSFVSFMALITTAASLGDGTSISSLQKELSLPSMSYQETRPAGSKQQSFVDKLGSMLFM